MLDLVSGSYVPVVLISRPMVEKITSKKLGLMPSLLIRFLIGLFFRLFWIERVIFLYLNLGSATIKR
jgi:hypothetical protein